MESTPLEPRPIPPSGDHAARITRLGDKVQELGCDSVLFRQSIQALREPIDMAIANLRWEIQAQIKTQVEVATAKLEARIDSLEIRMERLEVRMDQLSRRLDWMVGLMITSLLGQVALLIRQL